MKVKTSRGFKKCVWDPDSSIMCYGLPAGSPGTACRSLERFAASLRAQAAIRAAKGCDGPGDPACLPVLSLGFLHPEDIIPDPELVAGRGAEARAVSGRGGSRMDGMGPDPKQASYIV